MLNIIIIVIARKENILIYSMVKKKAIKTKIDLIKTVYLKTAIIENE